MLALDIGGTTAKCSLIENGHVKIMTDYWIERSRRSSGYPIMVPVVDLVEIGNGGGSIAWVDDFGKLHVGPRSAGAMPGPASYGRGGTEATTTDANLALGRIDKDYFCGGMVKADMDAVDVRWMCVAGRLGVDRIEAARGIVRIANSNMINALKLVSLNRGYDPRDFTLVAFGGGGGMHGVALASELGIRKVVIPRGASVFSAWGMMMSDLRRDYFVTRLIAQRWRHEWPRRILVEEAKPGRGHSSAEEGSPPGRSGSAVRQVPLPEPGTRRGGALPRRLGECRYHGRDDAREIPRVYRARIHLSARGAGRDRRPPPRCLSRGRQARDRPHAR